MFIIRPSLPTDSSLFFLAKIKPIISVPPVDAPQDSTIPRPVPPSKPPTNTLVKTSVTIGFVGIKGEFEKKF